MVKVGEAANTVKIQTTRKPQTEEMVMAMGMRDAPMPRSTPTITPMSPPANWNMQVMRRRMRPYSITAGSEE